MIARTALNLQVGDDVSLYLLLPLSPHVRAENTHEHTRVDADCEEEDEGDEEDHGNRVGPPSHH